MHRSLDFGDEVSLRFRAVVKTSVNRILVCEYEIDYDFSNLSAYKKYSNLAPRAFISTM